MSLALDAPASTVSAAPVRRRSWLPLVALLLAVGGIAATLVLVAPRAASFATIAPRATGAPFVTVPDYGARGASILGYEHDRVVQLTLPVRNDGLLPLTVTSVDLGNGPAPLLAVREVEGLPVTLRPGGRADVTVTAQLTNCKYFSEREIQHYTSARLGFRSLGRGGTRAVAFDRPIWVPSPMIIGCPDRKLDREADNRRDLL
jgi:hypothetical protein